MEYKGYVAEVEFDDSIEILHGRVVNSGPYPIATFQANEARELRREFERSIDEYLAWCEEDGVTPQRPFSGKLNLRLGTELHAAVATAAASRRMSINAWIVRAVRKAVGGDSRNPTHVMRRGTPTKDRLDPEEQEILEAFEQGALRRPADADEQIAAAVETARRTLRTIGRVRPKP